MTTVTSFYDYIVKLYKMSWLSMIKRKEDKKHLHKMGKMKYEGDIVGLVSRQMASDKAYKSPWQTMLCLLGHTAVRTAPLHLFYT